MDRDVTAPSRRLRLRAGQGVIDGGLVPASRARRLTPPFRASGSEVGHELTRSLPIPRCCPLAADAGSRHLRSPALPDDYDSRHARPGAGRGRQGGN